MAFTLTPPEDGRATDHERWHRERDALLEERLGYERSGRKDRLAAVDAALEALGPEPASEAAAAETAAPEPENTASEPEGEPEQATSRRRKRA